MDLPSLQGRLERLWVGTFMTSLDMHGLSLTLMKLDDELLGLLDAPAQARSSTHGRHPSSHSLSHVLFQCCLA